MEERKRQADTEETIHELLDTYEEHLREIFAKDTFKLSFDEREKLIDGKMKKETSSVIEKHIEEDPEGIAKNNNNPDETCLCVCGIEAILCKDERGYPKEFEREIQTKNGHVKMKEYGYYCSKERKMFFPHRKILKLFKENYSPDLLHKIVYAGAHSTFEEAQENLSVIGEISISTSHIQRLTIRTGTEFAIQDDKAADLWEEVPEQSDTQIEVASVSVDGGRAQIREEDNGAGVHSPAWVETKVGCLQVLESKEVEKDPHPMLPKAFHDRKTVKRMVEGLKCSREKDIEENRKKSEEQKVDSQNHTKETKSDDTYGPTVVKKFVVATVEKSDTFGNLISHKTHENQLHTAKRKAYLGDGDRKIWTIFEDYFRLEKWTPILDSIHAIEYVYEASKLSTEDELCCWKKYIEFVVHIWQGRVLTVIRRLDKIIEDLNRLRKSKYIQGKIEKLESIRNYFKNNYKKMDYPEYRKKGLPISSCHVESLIKQINVRVKSTEKFWNETSLKGVLKLKASLLSNDNSWQQFWDDRYEHQVNSKRSYLKLAA